MELTEKRESEYKMQNKGIDELSIKVKPTLQPTILNGMCVDANQLNCNPLHEEDGVGFIAERNGKFLIIDCFGYEISKDEYDKISYFKNEIAVVTKNNLYGFINKDCNAIIECKLEGYAELNDTQILFVKDNQWGVIDTLTSKVIYDLTDRETLFKAVGISDKDLELLSDNWLPKSYL